MLKQPIKNLLLSFFILSTLFLCSCRTVPFTGKSQLNVVSNEKVLALSETQYVDVLKKAKKSTNTTEIARLNRVGKKLAKEIDRYLLEKNIPNTFKWEFTLIEDKQVNAWCMPGGKIAVYTGILPITKDDTGLAVVLGHEIAHALAEHGHQRMNQALAAKLGVTALGVGLGLSQATDGQTNQVILAASGALVSYGIVLPNSRDNEHEADEIGLKIMARAGYNPEEAVPFWQRMAAASKGKKPPEFMSTHPGDVNRINFIKKHLPSAMYEYRRYRNRNRF
jgi:predicted Zn-dependent protease